MSMREAVAIAAAAAFTLAAVAAGNARGDECDDQKGKVHLEVHAELTQSGIAAITQMQNGQMIIGCRDVSGNVRSLPEQSFRAPCRSPGRRARA